MGRATAGTVRIGGAHDCRHKLDTRTYLGHMGPTAFYRCERCGGVILEDDR